MTRDRVVDVYKRLLQAWNDQDAVAFGSACHEDANVVGFDGSQMNGRQEIVTTLRGIFDNHRTATYVSKIREVRALDDHVTLVRAVVGMVPPGAAELNPSVNAIQSVVVTNNGGRLSVALLHNTPAAFHGRPEQVQLLTRELTDALATGRLVTVE